MTHEEKYNGNSVIERGYEIYDEWVNKQLDSRKIAALAYGAAGLYKESEAAADLVEALAHLFALDTRIRERYKSIWRCLISYFSWRREIRALRELMAELDIPLGEEDIRNAVELGLVKHADKLENDPDEDGDDNTSGGRSNGMAEEEPAAEAREAEQTAEEGREAEELTEEELTEEHPESSEHPIEQEPLGEAEIGAEPAAEPAAEPEALEAEAAATDEVAEAAEAKDESIKEENNGSKEDSEPSTDKEEKREEPKTYNDAVDSPPIFEWGEGEKAEEKRSFIDEMIIDDMVKGDKSIIGYRRIDEAARIRQANNARDAAADQGARSEITDGDDRSRDEAFDRSDMSKTGNASDHGAENSKEAEQSAVRELFSVDINASAENALANEINNNISEESVKAFYQMQAEQMREQLSIASEELGMDAPVEIIGAPETRELAAPETELNRK